MKYFKVFRGFDQNDYIPIDETELVKAVYAHMTGKPVALQNGSINGTHISAIMPDWNRTMGWNPTHKLGDDDWNDIKYKEVDKLYLGAIADAKSVVYKIIETGDLTLLDQPEKLKLENGKNS